MRAARTKACNETVRWLADLWSEILTTNRISRTDDFFALGGDSLLAMRLANRLQERMRAVVHPSIVFDASTLESMALYLDERYADRASRRLSPLTKHDLEELRSLIPTVGPGLAPAVRGPGPVFVLSAPRTGSSLLRIMLTGHPDIFAPPELKLLSFSTLRERHEETSGRDSFMLEGSIRALKELDRSTSEEAVRAMEALEERNLSTCDFYQLLQERIRPRMLVDKTAAYGQDLAVLRRAEAWFDQPRYIRLLRHPCGMIGSFEDARLDLVRSFEHPFAPRELAELLWCLSYQNIETFLADVPRERVHDVRFEELVRDPEAVMASLCTFLGLSFHPDMARPYANLERRMVDGLHDISRPIGDPKFLAHRRIDPAVAERWREPGKNLDPGHLGAMTQSLAADLGYDLDAVDGAAAPVEMTPRELLAILHDRGVRIAAEVDELRVHAPRGTLDDDVRSALRRHKRELLAMLKVTPSEGGEPHRVVSGSAGPVSYAQERLWFLDRLEPDRVTHRVQRGLRLHGALDVDALRRALNGIVSRHESVRTVFSAVDGLPHPRSVDPLVLPLRVERMQGDPEAMMAQIVGEELVRPFDLARGPLIRARLVELGDDDYVLTLTLHRLVADDASVDILLRELAALYQAHLDGRPSPLPDLAVQYTDYVDWQRRAFQDGRLEPALTFWRERLGNDRPPLNLTTDRPRPRVQTHRGRTLDLDLDGAQLDALHDLSQSANGTLFTTMLAAFNVLLMRHTGQDDISVGIPVAGRACPEFEGLVGPHSNTLVLRTDLSGEPTFRGLLDRVRRVASEAYDHQEMPFEALLGELQPERDASRSPLFQVFCNMIDASASTFDFADLRVKPVRVPYEMAKFDLLLYLLEMPGQLRVQLNYNTDLFDEATIGVMLEQYRALLADITSDPDRPLAALSLVDETVAQVRVDSGPRVAPRGEHRVFTADDTASTIPARFAEQVACGPDRPAIVTPSVSWTYGELDGHAERAAAAIRRAHGAGDGRIALLFDTGAPMVAGLLGTLRAGLAYVPLDPAYPLRRLEFMLDDAGTTVIVTDGRRRALAEQLAGDGRIVVDLDAVAGTDDVPPPIPTDPDAMAYVLYTSGSTGQPKGVVQSHRNVLGHIRAHTNALGITERDRLTLMSSYTFDAAIVDVYGALLNGATLYPIALHQLPLAESMCWLRDAGITIFHSTPSVFRLLMTEFEGEEIPWPAARLVVLGGEETRPRDIDLYHRHFGPECLLVNGLGSSESTFALHQFIDHAFPAGGARVPVGEPVEGTEVVLLDEAGNITEVYGEIAIVGHNVALGYWNRPDATAAAFETLADGRRRYRTGDIGRRRADGAIEFIGRRDMQVKVRGYRIEPGEVETALIDHDAVQAAAVIAVGPPSELIAYVVPEGDEQPDIVVLQRHVQERLPSFMVPSGFVWIDAVPMTPNGKLDRAALPAPTRSEPFGGEHALPETETERVVAQIWMDLLERDCVGVHDNWFDLGGHSLLALGLMSRMRDAFGLSLPLAAVFEAPTVRGLAAVVEQCIVEEVLAGFEEASVPTAVQHRDLGASLASNGAAPARRNGHKANGVSEDDPNRLAEMTTLELLSHLRARGVQLAANGDRLRVNAASGTLNDALKAALRRHKSELLEFLRKTQAEDDVPLRRTRREAAPLSFAQERLWFLDRFDPGSPAYNVHQSLRIYGELDVDALRRALNEIVARHEGVRTIFPAMNGLPQQRMLDTVRLPLTVERAEGDPDTVIPRLVEEESTRPFDLVQGPLIRARLFQFGDDDHLLMLTLHHIVTDAWSMGVLSRELAELYQAFVDGRPSPLPDLPVQYADYADWQRRFLEGERLERMLGFWRKRLGDDPPPLNLLTDRPRPRVQTHRGRTLDMDISGRELEALRDLDRSAGVTLFMTLLAAFKVLLMRHTGQGDISVGIPVAGRTRPEVEGLVGCFINTLVLRTDLSGELTFRGLLDRVLRVASEAYDHQEMPFEALLGELQPERDASRSPLFQVFCNMIDASASTFDFADLRVRPVRVPYEMAKFDLSLYLLEMPGQLRVQLNYNTDLFDEATIGVMLEQYRALLADITSDPDRPLAALSLVDETVAQVRVDSGPRVAPRGEHRVFTADDTASTIPARFAEQVACGPDRPAIVTPSVSWTYGELDGHAERAAAAIRRAHGAGDGRIALLFDTGAPMFAGLLGTLRADLAYVPLDPAYPLRRLEFMLDDAETTVIVTDGRRRALAEQLAGDGRVVVDLDAVAGTDDVPPIPTDPDAMAYVLYTSGSTGQPKGVVQSHRNVLGHIRAYTNALRITERDRLTLMSSYTFDAAIMDVYGALLNGATLYPVTLQDEPVDQIASRLRESRITIFHSTPSVFRLLATEFEGEEIPWPATRLVVLGGEETRPRDIDLYHRHFGPECLLVNGLGPSESTLALQQFIDHAFPAGGARVPVGEPVEGTEVVLLDEAGNITEVYGEIDIVGHHVALGYWNRPDATAAAFETLADGRRRYRTGDIGRRRADGAIEFIGRRDMQVKVRGYRIEPGEIEAALIDHDAVQAAAVIAVGTPSELIAYVVPEGDEQPDIVVLQRHVQERLPSFMVPSGFVWIDAVPMTPNGKLDRDALPAPVRSEPSGGEHALPETETERVVAEIWMDLLEIDRVGVRDSWFDLGGHSLLALRLVSRIRDAFALSLPLAAVFEAPTVRGLAAVIEQRIVEEIEAIPEEALAQMVEATGIGAGGARSEN